MNAQLLAATLADFAGISATSKKANAFTMNVEVTSDNEALQSLVGDPDTHPLSWSSQHQPSTGVNQIPNPLSPLEGDQVFFSGLFDGARFQAHDGSWWNILSYDFEGGVTIENVWYPRQVAVVSIQDIRRSIHSWIEPFLQRVPPMPEGVDYGIVEVRDVDKK